MTESVKQSSSAEIRAAMAMEVELSGVDAIAKFRFDDAWKIHEFGAHIDAIPGMTTEYSQTLRGVANLINEPDTETQAFDVAPSFSYPASQERFRVLSEASDMDQYLRFSQSQSNSSQVPLGQPTQEPSSSGSSYLHPLPNQQANRQRLNIPRKSPRRSAAPRNLAGYVLDDEGPSKRKAESARGSSSKTLELSTSEEEDAYILATDAPGGRSSDEEDVMPSPRAGSKRQRLADSTDSGSAGTKLALSEKAAGKRVKRPTTAEIKEMNKASRIPEPEPTRTAAAKRPPAKAASSKSKSKSKAKRPRKKARAADSMSDNDEEDDESDKEDSDQDDSDHPSKRHRSASQSSTAVRHDHPSKRHRSASQSPTAVRQPTPRLKAPKASTTPGTIYEGDIPISGPAKASKLGLPGVLTTGYDGFSYLYSWRSGHIIREKWKCLSCGNPYTCSKAGHNSNLVSHRDHCKGPETAAAAGGPIDDGQAARDDQDGSTRPTRTGRSSAVVSTAASSTLASSSYRGPSVSGWIGGQQITHPLLTRRLGLIMVINNALPFQHLRSPAVVEFAKSIDARATKSLMSDKTVRRDLTRFHTALKVDVRQELQGLDTLVSLQHDAWTTKAYQHSFVATIASYVTRDWDYREVLLSFDVIRDKHTGATFSGHLIRTLNDYGLDNKWYGPVTSDSTGVNHRMLDVLQYQLSRKDMQQRNVINEVDGSETDAKHKASPSAFPHASARKKGTWLATQNKILCLNHHVNIAVRAGFAKFGIKFKAKTKRKVLDLRPAPPITVTDENGNAVELEDEDVDDDDEANDEEEEEKDTSDKEAEDGEGGDDSDSDSSENDDDTHPEVDVDADESGEDSYRTDMEPCPSEIGSEDEGGPAAEEEIDDDEDIGDNPGGKITSAIAKLEAFTVDIHRSPQRRADFRARMEKEYHRKPKKANAPFPSKPNGTRWNSHWSMIKRSLRIRDAIDAHCRAFIGSKKDKFGNYLLSESQWRQLELLKPILKLSKAVTMSMEHAEGTLYMVLDHHASLRDEVQVLLATVDEEQDNLDGSIAEEMRAFAMAMSAKLTKYRDLALENRLTLAAGVLYPYNRLELFETAYPEYERRAEKALRSLLAELVGNADSGTGPPSKKTPAAATATLPSPISAARARRKHGVAAEKSASSSTEKEPDEVARYLDMKFCPWRETDKSPYKWWKDNEELFPNLSKLARVVLAVPGSSSSVERVFSKAALFSTNRRARLTSASISKLVTTRLWLAHGGDKYAGLDEDVRRCAKMLAELPDLLSK